MVKKESGEQEIVIDVRYLVIALLKKAWAIALVGAIVAISSFVYNTKFVKPKYSSSVMLYVNNSSFSVGATIESITAADLSASQSLIDTYSAILHTRTTMEMVAEDSGLGYTYQQLSAMIKTQKVEGTEVFRVVVEAEDPYHAAVIANSVSDVLPERIEGIIDGTSMRVVDSAVVNNAKISPNVTRNVIFAFIIGVVLAAAVIAVLVILDDTIRDDDYLTNTYDFPILSRIPNITKDAYKYSYKQDPKTVSKEGEV